MSMEMSRLSENRARYAYVDQSWRWVIIMIRRGQLRHLHLIHSIGLIPKRMYRTGDYGRRDEDGILHFCGRMDRQIKHMGHRVELDEVERTANVVEGVAESCVIYNKAKEVLILFYTGDCDRRSLALALRDEPRALWCQGKSRNWSSFLSFQTENMI